MEACDPWILASSFESEVDSELLGVSPEFCIAVRPSVDSEKVGNLLALAH